MKAEIIGKNLVITIELQKATRSASGKSMVCASTNGNVTTDCIVDGKPLTIGLNAYYKAN